MNKVVTTIIAFLTLALIGVGYFAWTSSAEERLEARNEALVVEMWHTLIDERDLAQAPRFIAEDYIQHTPGIGQGRAEVVVFLERVLGGAAARPKSEVRYTEFEHVIADGDLVQLVWKRTMPSPRNPAETIDLYWYDTYRVRSGIIVEHWDSAAE